MGSLGIRVIIVRQVLHPTNKIDDEKDDENCAKADIHKNLR